MLRVEIYVNRKRVAVADALNVRGEIVSDYIVSALTESNPYSGADCRTGHAEIRRHRRAQSVWALVAKIATRLAADDRARDSFATKRAAPADPLPTGGSLDRGGGER